MEDNASKDVVDKANFQSLDCEAGLESTTKKQQG